MNSMTTKILLASLMGSVLGLDRVFMQVMASRPIVSAPLVGLMLGDVYTGLMAGAALELFWIDRLPIGTCVPPNDFLVAVLIAASAIIAGQELGRTSRELVALSALLFIPFGYLGQRLDGFIIGSNDALSHEALEDAKRANITGIFWKHMAGLGKVFLGNFIFILFSLLLGVALLTLIFPLLPPACATALTMTYFSFPLLGVAAGLTTINLRGAVPIFCAVFLTASMLLELIHVF